MASQDDNFHLADSCIIENDLFDSSVETNPITLNAANPCGF